MIQLSKVNTSIRKTEILHDVSFSVLPGEFVALVGPNGAGKTTLLKHLNGLIKPTSGTVTVCGIDTRRTKTSELARHVGFLFQNPDQQILCPTVREELRFGLKHCGIPKATWDERIEVAARMTDLSAKLDSDPLMLTRSRRQRVALASVLATDPEILVLDEPTSAQDERETQRIMDIARELRGRGKTIILVSHDMELVSTYADRVIVLIDGRIALDGEPGRVFSDRELLSRARLSMPSIYRMSAALNMGMPDRFTNRTEGMSGGTDLQVCAVTSIADRIERMIRKEVL